MEGEYHSIGLDYTSLYKSVDAIPRLSPYNQTAKGHVSASAKGACHDIALVALVWLTKVCITLYLAAMQCRPSCRWLLLESPGRDEWSDIRRSVKGSKRQEITTLMENTLYILKCRWFYSSHSEFQTGMRWMESRTSKYTRRHPPFQLLRYVYDVNY